MTELMPCPFCGSAPYLTKNYPYTDVVVHCVGCARCHFHVEGDGREGQAKAIAAWNTRVPASASPSREGWQLAKLLGLLMVIHKIAQERGDAEQNELCSEATLALSALRPAGDEGNRIDWYAAYERMARNRNELFAKLQAVEAALAAQKEGA